MRARRFLAAAAALSLVATACGGDDDDDAAPATEEDTGAEDTGGEDTGGEDTGGEDTGGEDTGGEDTGGEDTGGEETGGGEAGGGGNLVLLQWQAPSQVNGLLSTGTKDIQASSLVLEPLAENDPDGGLVPALAAEIPTIDNGGVAEDFSSITWTLRDDVVWADGTPFTAADVVFTYEYCSNEETGCSALTFTEVESVVPVDDYTVTVNFSSPQPYPYIPFVNNANPIIQQAQFADCVGAAAVGCSEQNFAPIGTGPYQVTDMRPEDTVTYEINPNYRGISEGKPFFDTVEIKGGGDAEAAARSVLEVGEADYAWNVQVAPEILAGMEAAGNGMVVSGFASSVEHISLNQTDPNADPPSEGTPHPLFVDNPDLHRALSISINRDELVAVGYGPSGAPTCNIWPAEPLSTNNDWCLTQNIEEANALLDGLDYMDTDGDGVREAPDFGPLEFDYVTSTNDVRQSNQELVKSYWEQIGVKANILNEDASLFFDGTCASDVCIWKFFTPIQMYTNSSTTGPYAGGYLNSFSSDKIPTSATSWGGDNIYRINDPEMDALIEEMEATSTEDPRYAELVIEINDRASTSAIIPLIHRAEASAISNSIEGFGTLNGWDSEYWNIEEWTRAG